MTFNFSQRSMTGQYFQKTAYPFQVEMNQKFQESELFVKKYFSISYFKTQARILHSKNQKHE